MVLCCMCRLLELVCACLQKALLLEEPLALGSELLQAAQAVSPLADLCAATGRPRAAVLG
jgi:hypothetical protein